MFNKLEHILRRWLGHCVGATVLVTCVMSPVYADDFDFLFSEEPAEVTEKNADERSGPTDGDHSAVDRVADNSASAKTAPKVVSSQASASVRVNKRPVIEEVIVTSQKRAENIRDVPISVSALDGEALKANNVANMNDLSLYTPNVKFQVTPNSTFINIRGLGTGENRGFEQSVGLVIDGVYYGRGDFMLGGTLDMSRIEVLRGPQGTLFGKNTIAGALNISTGQPENEFHGDVDAMTGDFNHQRYRGAITGPISDTVSWRLAFQDETRDGYILNTGVDEFHANLENQMVRSKLRWEPSEAFSATLGFDVNEVSQRGDGYQISKVVGDHSAVYLSADDDAEFDGTNFQSSMDDPRSGGTRDIFTSTLNMSWDVGDFNITSITGHANMDVRQDVDADFSAHRFLFLGYVDTYQQFSQELRFTSGPGDVEYVAGLYYFQSQFEVNTSIESYAEGAPVFLAPAFGGPVVGGPIFGGPLGSIGGVLTGPVIDDASRKYFNQTANAWAGFGQATWYVTDRWSLIGGLRYGVETKEVDMRLTFDNTGLLYTQILGEETYDTSDGSFTRSEIFREEVDFSPKFSTKFDFNDDINVYATYAEGFKSGGFNAQAPTRNNIQFEPEEATTYELGSKMRLLGGGMTLNIGLFSTDFNNLQVTIFNGTQFVVGNAATARTQGLEFDGMWLPFENAALTFSGGYTDATYVSYPDGPCWADGDGGAGPNPRERGVPNDATADPTDEQCFQDLSGQPLTRAPKWNGSVGLEYGFAVPNVSWRLLTGLNFLYQSETFLNLDNDPVDLQPATTQINAKIGVAGRDDDWSLTIHGRNLTNELIYLESADVPLLEGDHFNRQDLPRTIAAEFRLLW